MRNTYKPKPGARVKSTDTGALGTFLGGGRTHFDAVVLNGVSWPARTVFWPTTKLTAA